MHIIPIGFTNEENDIPTYDLHSYLELDFVQYILDKFYPQSDPNHSICIDICVNNLEPK